MQISVGEIVLLLGALATLLGAFGTYRKQQAESKTMELASIAKAKQDAVALTEQIQRVAAAELKRYETRVDELEKDVAQLRAALSELTLQNDRLRRHGKQIIEALEEFFRQRYEAMQVRDEVAHVRECLLADIELLEKVKAINAELGDGSVTPTLDDILAVKKAQLEQKSGDSAQRTVRQRRKRNE